MDPQPPTGFSPPTVPPPCPPPFAPTSAPLPYVPPPRVWTVFTAFFIAFFVGSVVAGIVAVSIALAIHGPELMGDQQRLQQVITRPAIFLPMLFSTQVVLAGVALGGGLLSPVPMKRRLRLGRARLPWYGYGILALGTIALGYTSGIIIELLGFGSQGVLEEFEKAMAGLRGPVLVVAAAVIGLSPGLGEELLFRGYIQTRLGQRWPRLLAVLVTSVLFGVIHFDFVQSTFAVFLGLWMGEVTDRTGSVWPAVFGHSVNNVGATLLGALAETHAQTVSEAPGWELAVTVPLLALCLLYLLRRPAVPNEPEPVATVLAQPVAPVLP